jgi:hypothetical protein
MPSSGPYKPSGKAVVQLIFEGPTLTNTQNTTASRRTGPLIREWAMEASPLLQAMSTFSTLNLTFLLEFAHGKVNPHEAGHEGGKTSGSDKSTEQD